MFLLQYGNAIFNRGDSVFAYSTDGTCTTTNWDDSKHVLMLSTLPHITNQIGSCQRSTVDKNGKFQKITVTRPKIIEEYSRKMFFVDRGYESKRNLSQANQLKNESSFLETRSSKF